MKTRVLDCTSCESVFSVEHDMDDHFYPVEWCPFCGGKLELEETIDEDYLEPDEEIEQ